MYILYWALAHSIAILTLVLAVSTVYLTRYTAKLVEEARESRQALSQPIILIYLEQSETDPTIMFLIVKNIGKGIAYDLTFDIQKDIGTYQGSMTIGSRGLFKEGMKFFPPDYLKKYFLIETRNDNEIKMEEELIITAKYRSVFQKATDKFIDETFHLRLKEHKKTGKISPSDTYIGSIDETLKEIKNILKTN